MGRRAHNSSPVTQPHRPHRQEHNPGNISSFESFSAADFEGINSTLSNGFGLCGSLTGGLLGLLSKLWGLVGAFSLVDGKSCLFLNIGDGLLLSPDKLFCRIIL